MLYSKVYIDSFGHELAPNVVTSEDIEKQLEPLYKALHLQKGQLEALTGIRERRFWDPDYKMSEGAVCAGQKALEHASVSPEDIDMLIYCGICKDYLEPATACAVAHGLGLRPATQVYDVSNACLGVLNAMLQVANAIELGQIQAGLLVSCESSRQVIELTIRHLLETKDMNTFKNTVATLTGGCGAVAILLTSASIADSGHRILGGVVKNAVEYHQLCTWGLGTGISAGEMQLIQTESVGVLQNGVALGTQTFKEFKKELSWPDDKPDKIICHQVGATHRKIILESIGVAEEKDFTTFKFLGNIGSVSLPITAAIASERDFLRANDEVGFLGIGSGLNCLMLGIKW
ncbi:MAG: 3-oxoacyl-ACP synthase III [Desulfobacterales bacterium]|nr:3-oxoacyl-ACP synthase III [Desulfobacterales bacterium]